MRTLFGRTIIYDLREKAPHRGTRGRFIEIVQVTARKDTEDEGPLVFSRGSCAHPVGGGGGGRTVEQRYIIS